MVDGRSDLHMQRRAREQSAKQQSSSKAKRNLHELKYSNKVNAFPLNYLGDFPISYHPVILKVL